MLALPEGRGQQAPAGQGEPPFVYVSGTREVNGSLQDQLIRIREQAGRGTDMKVLWASPASFYHEHCSDPASSPRCSPWVTISTTSGPTRTTWRTTTLGGEKAKSITEPVPGNHEYGGDPTATPDGYFQYFGEHVKGTKGEGYYSYDLPAGCTPGHRVCWHFIALNAGLCMAPGGCGPSPARSTLGLGNQMCRWLKHDVAAHPNSRYRCTHAYWHQPLFSFATGSGRRGK